MARKTKRETLPKDFEEVLKTGDLPRLEAIFERCDVNARGGYAKQTALAFDECPDALARWLVERGADLSSVDTWGNTPLHRRARSRLSNIDVLLELGAGVNAAGASIGTPLHAAADSRHAANAAKLLKHGAAVDARNEDGLTPLELALRGCTNAELELMPAFVRVMLEAGAARTQEMKKFVAHLGHTFESHREGFNRDHVEEASAALEYLYVTFEVTPIPRRKRHDGVEAIVVRETTWQGQHAELWDLLVPSSGAAKTVQGEVIRIAGRIGDEWERNGGGNWDADYQAMANALVHYFGTGAALDAALIEETKTIARSLRARDGAGHDRLAELAVGWVLQNPHPIALERPVYRR